MFQSRRALFTLRIQRQDTFPRVASRGEVQIFGSGGQIFCFVGRRGSTTSGDALAPPGRTE